MSYAAGTGLLTQQPSKVPAARGPLSVGDAETRVSHQATAVRSRLWPEDTRAQMDASFHSQLLSSCLHMYNLFERRGAVHMACFSPRPPQLCLHECDEMSFPC